MGKPPFRRRKKVCEFCEAKIEHIDYKQVDVLKDTSQKGERFFLAV